MLLKVGLWFCFCFSNFLARNQFGGRKSATLKKKNVNLSGYLRWGKFPVLNGSKNCLPMEVFYFRDS